LRFLLTELNEEYEILKTMKDIGEEDAKQIEQMDFIAR